MSAASPDEIRQATQRVLSSDDYRLDLEEHALQPFWERLWEILVSILHTIAGFFSFLDGMPQVVRWIIILALLVILVLLVGHILAAIVSAIRSPQKQRRTIFDTIETRDHPDRWEQESLRLAEVGNFVEASRLLLQASLVRLEAAFDRPFRRAATNREYLRKYRNLPIVDAVRELVDTVDRTWYGDEPCEPGDYELCRRAHLRVLESIRNGFERRRRETA